MKGVYVAEDQIEPLKKQLESLGFVTRYSETDGKVKEFIYNRFPYCDTERPLIVISTSCGFDAEIRQVKFGNNWLNRRDVIYVICKMAELGIIHTEDY